MIERGAKQVALTTQDYNYRSQRLYERNGFRRGRWAYEIYGRWLNAPEGTY
jgi:RimJ/RimL family protein N-acetyltransferase